MAFHEIRFPLRLSLTTRGGPERLTDVVSLTNGREARNRRFRFSRRRYDVGSALRSVADLYAVLEFFEARGGRLHGFRFRDPVDFSSARPGEAVGPLDQILGEGDGETRRFALVKAYGDQAAIERRPVQKPVAGSVRIAVDGVERLTGFAVDAATGMVTFEDGHVPDDGAEIRAGFDFDVPVRFDTERIEIDLEAFRAGRIPSIPLIEVMP
ncbi:phage distal tail protein, Rcc01695 family [Rhizobium sp. G187]|uniref:phage distal tail protein, Rcc01695 family n=1 Tax=Rhizobium sp. G187 TaxID=3451352 RepID=UPI003EE63F71